MTATDPTFGWRIPSPDGSDDLKLLPVEIQNMISDIAATMNKRLRICTSTTRPAAPAAGDTIIETDTGRMYRWVAAGVLASGSAALWDQFAGPPEKYSLTYGTGFGDYGSDILVPTSGWQSLRVFKMGRLCWFEGVLQASATSPQTTLVAGTTYNIGTLPAACVPIANQQGSGPLFVVPGQGMQTTTVTGSTGAVTMTPINAGASGWNATPQCRWRTVA